MGFFLKEGKICLNIAIPFRHYGAFFVFDNILHANGSIIGGSGRGAIKEEEFIFTASLFDSTVTFVCKIDKAVTNSIKDDLLKSIMENHEWLIENCGTTESIGIS